MPSASGSRGRFGNSEVASAVPVVLTTGRAGGKHGAGRRTERGFAGEASAIATTTTIDCGMHPWSLPRENGNAGRCGVGSRWSDGDVGSSRSGLKPTLFRSILGFPPWCLSSKS